MHFLNKASRWSVLKAIGGSYLGSLTILTPIVGYLLLVPGIEISVAGVEVIDGFSISSLGGELSKSSRLLYIGLFIIGIATIIFKMACPEEISKHKSLVAFIADEKGMYSCL